MFIRENDRIEPTYYLWNPHEYHVFIFPYRRDDMDVIGTFPDAETARRAAAVVSKYRGSTAMYESHFKHIETGEIITGFELLEYFQTLQEIEPDDYLEMKPDDFITSQLWQCGGSFQQV